MKFRTLALCLLVLSFLGSSVALALTLQESIDLAAKNNPSVIEAQKKLDAANARYRQAVGAFLPTLKVDGSYTKSYSQPSTMVFSSGTTETNVTIGTDATQTIRSLSASASQPLFVGALIPGYAIADKSTRLAVEELKKARLEINSSVTSAYYGVLSSRQFLSVAEESLAMAKSHLAQVGKMEKHGTATRADLLRAEVLVVNSELALTKARQAVALADSAFNNVLGRGLDERLEVADSEPSVKLPELNEQALFKTALEHKPEWRQFVLTREIANENLNVAYAGYLPTVMLTGQIGDRRTYYPGYDADVNSWTVAAAASWTLFDGLGIQNRIAEAQASLAAQQAAEEQIKNGVALEVREALLNIRSAAEAIVSTKKAVELAKESHKITQLRFSTGAGTNVEVLDAQVALNQAKVNHLKAVFDLAIARTKLNKAIGKEAI